MRRSCIMAEQASQPVALVSSPVKPGPDQGGFSVEDAAYAEDPGPEGVPDPPHRPFLPWYFRASSHHAALAYHTPQPAFGVGERRAWERQHLHVAAR